MSEHPEDALGPTVTPSAKAPAAEGTLDPTVTPSTQRTLTDGLTGPLPVAAADRYVVERELGVGGQSIVVAARDHSLGRDVALKTARQAGDAANAFVREARLTGQLEHPGIVPVHELGRTAAGEVYCTQKLVRGRTFRQALEDAQTLEARLALLPHFIDLCHAVAYAHSRGVVHRDLKPENVMVGEFGETVVLDWGIARVLGSPEQLPAASTTAEQVKPLQTVRRLEGVIVSGSTQRGSVMGTPLYMSPEQARGENDQVDARSDVWSLGVMLYELLAFTRPFEAKDVRSLLVDVSRGHVRPLAEVAPEAPPELAAIVEQAMQPDRARRFADARGMAAQLSDFRAGKRVAAYHYSSRELVARFVSKNRALTAVSLVGVLALAVSEVYAWSLVDARDKALQKSRAQAAREVVAQAHDAERLSAWTRASALHAAAAAEGSPDGRLAQALLAPWVSPLQRFAAELPVPASGAGSFDVESGQALLGSPGRGLFAVEGAGPWKLLEGTSDPERRALPSALAPGGLTWVVKGATLRLQSSQRAGAPLPGTEKALLVAFATDVAVAVPDAVRLHDGTTGALRVELSPAPAEPTALALGPTGGLAVAGADGSLRWWASPQAPSSEPRMVQGRRLTALAFSLDGRLLFTGDDEGRVQVLEAESGQVARTATVHRLPVRLLVAAPGGRSLATASLDGAVVLWDLATWKPLTRLQERGDEVRALSFSADGQRLGALERTGKRTVWDVSRLASRGPVATLEDGPAWSLTPALGGGAWVRTAQSLLLLSAEGQVRWRQADVRGGEALATPAGLWVGKPGQLDLYSASDGEVVQSEHPCRSTVWSVAGARTAPLLWLACGTELRMLDGDGPEAQSTGVHAKAAIRRLALSPAGDRLAWAAEDGSGGLLALPSRHEEARWSGRPSQALAFHPSGRWFATAGEDGVVLRWGESGNELRRLTASDLRVKALGFALDGAVVWAAGAEGVSLWNLETGARLSDLPGLHGELTAAAPSEDGQGLWLCDTTGRVFLAPLGR